MSNILIIKHGSLGDIAQISGALKDIRQFHSNNKIFILTTFQYVELLGRCPYVDAILIDRRLPRWNIIYLVKLKKMLAKYNFSYVYDLQNSSRTLFYQRYLLRSSLWCSTQTTLKKGTKKSDFNNESVLERFKIQLSNFNIKTNYTTSPDFSWACINVDQMVNKYFNKKFILIFPFSSPKLSHKQWPYYNNLIKIIKKKNTELEVVIAPGPKEIELAKSIGAISITNNKKALSIIELSGLIKKSSFVIANDTGPAHIAAHLKKEGLVIFGHHTTPKKVSIETDIFKAITVKDLRKLTAEQVYLEIEDRLKLIN
jgi:ADP-heptose:LPS heptosyltransferase